MVKKIIGLLLMISPLMGFGKKVKFSVDMTGQTISPNGVHVSGDFQDEAGFPSDWDSETTLMSLETGTNIYSVEVSIPAFRTYQYKFVNGNKFYEVEFVPEKSRVGFDFNDNRWIYVDSVTTDVNILPALIFGGNAPLGLKMIRYKLDLANQSIGNPKAIHVGTNYNQWKPEASHMVSFSQKFFETIEYTDSQSIEYLYMNGLAKEQVDSSCRNLKKNRFLKLNSDTVLEIVCFNKCSSCLASFKPSAYKLKIISIYPNPSIGQTLIKVNNEALPYQLSIFDISGKTIKAYKNISTATFNLETGYLSKGIYLLNINGTNKLNTTLKLFVE